MAGRRSGPCPHAPRHHADYSFTPATCFWRRQATERRGLRLDHRIVNARAESRCHPRKRTYVYHLVRHQPAHWSLAAATSYSRSLHDCIVVDVLRIGFFSQDSKRTSSVAVWNKVFTDPQPRMQAIEDRAHRLLRVPNKNRAEGLQVVSYDAGQRYDYEQLDRTAHLRVSTD